MNGTMRFGWMGRYCQILKSAGKGYNEGMGSIKSRMG